MIEIVVPAACIPCRYGAHNECEGDHCDDTCPDNKSPWRVQWQARALAAEAEVARLRDVAPAR